MSRSLLLLGVSLSAPAEARTQETEPAKVTVSVRGMVTGEDARAIRTALGTVEGITFNADDVQPGEKGPFRHYFSPPFVIELSDLNVTDVGTLAAAVARTKTPSREDLTPSLNLILFDPDGSVDEEEISSFRQIITSVNGVEAQVPGGVGGVPSEGRLWVRLEAAGGANLPLIEQALRKARLELTFVKP